MICPRRSDPRHTAQKQQFDVLIHYPHHPCAGEKVFVVRTVQHAGTVHFVIDLADGTRGLLPEWMTEPSAANLPLVETVLSQTLPTDPLGVRLPATVLAGEQMIEFKGSHFERDVILWAVRWYVAYPISYRQLEEMMGEHGVEVDHATLNRSFNPCFKLVDDDDARGRSCNSRTAGSCSGRPLMKCHRISIVLPIPLAPPSRRFSMRSPPL
jgi:hypothetical protein